MSSRTSLHCFNFSQAISAFNDNGFKLAVVTILTIHLQKDDLAILTAGLFSLIFFLFCASATYMTIKYSQVKIFRINMLAQVIACGIVSLGLFFHITWLMIIAIMLVALTRTFFVPLRYTYTHTIVPSNKMQRANSLIFGATFIAILSSYICGSLISHSELMLVIITTAMLILIVIAACVSFFLNATAAANPSYPLGLKFYNHLFRSIHHSLKLNKRLFKHTLLYSWIFALAGTSIIMIVTINRTVWHSNEYTQISGLVVTILGVFSGTLCSRFIKHHALTIRMITIFFILMAITLLGLGIALHGQPHLYRIYYLGELLKNPRFDVSNAMYFLIAYFFGILSIPLITSFQHQNKNNENIDVIACNTALNSFFIFAILIIISCLRYFKVDYWIISLIYGIATLVFIFIITVTYEK